MGLYDDIINLEYRKSNNHKHMSIEARSAQFAPFAALSGFDEQIANASKTKQNKYILEDDEKNILDIKFKVLLSNIKNRPDITITYFLDEKYVTISGITKKIDIINKYLYLEDNTKIFINNIINIEGNIFNNTNL